MKYKSTRDSAISLSASQVIAQGISAEGGLFVPETFPSVSDKLQEWSQLNYKELAKELFALFLTDFSPEEIADCVDGAYTAEKFGSSEPVKLVSLTADGENKHLLELWHGPTCAFKDMALQILPHFITKALKKAPGEKEAVILTATSGDTGKAALEGFCDVPGTRIIVFYPQHGVSPMQKRQMVTQSGSNVAVCAINGNFDDAQAAVKRIFTDEKMKADMASCGKLFSSANSINWGRLLPQVVYYFYAYFQLFRQGVIKSLNEKVNITVPTGNFGNILAAYYAMRMGLPVNKFICASNSNNVLTDFIQTGTYNRQREFLTTASPSMDILVSSNLERLLYALSGENSHILSEWMNRLAADGCYTVDELTKNKLQALFFGGYCDDSSTLATIRDMLENDGYLCDTHTAVAVSVYRKYVEETGDRSTPVIIASTASPYKFTASVLGAIEKNAPKDEFDAIARLEQLSGTKAPKQLIELRNKPVRFSNLIANEQTEAFVRHTVGIGGA